jgi:putative transposase
LGTAAFLRKRNRLGPDAYVGPQAYFVTLGTFRRAKSFIDSTLVVLLVDLLRESCSVASFEVYAYCFMPDHLHLVLLGINESSALSPLVRTFKGKASAAARSIGVRELWQKGFFDHMLRNGESIDAAANYVFMNPVRAGLVRQAHEWRTSGSFVFDWKGIPVST